MFLPSADRKKAWVGVQLQKLQKPFSGSPKLPLNTSGTTELSYRIKFQSAFVSSLVPFQKYNKK